MGIGAFGYLAALTAAGVSVMVLGLAISAKLGLGVSAVWFSLLGFHVVQAAVDHPVCPAPWPLLPAAPAQPPIQPVCWPPLALTAACLVRLLVSTAPQLTGTMW